MIVRKASFTLIMLGLVVGVCFGVPECRDLKPVQYSCEDPFADLETNALDNCGSNYKVEVTCTVLNGVECTGDNPFTIEVTCARQDSPRWRRALGFSLFTGIFGFDRCYLGYPGIGVLKAATAGGFIVGALLDTFAIAGHKLLPADGGPYLVETENQPIYAASDPNFVASMKPVAVRRG